MATAKPKAKSPAKKPRTGELAAPKGMRDIMGEDYYLFQGFFEKAQEVAMYYGFKPIETPMLEQEEIFTSGIGEGTDIIDKEMYSLRTKGGDHLALRPEHTAPLMRAYIEHGMGSQPQPVLFYQSGPVFRHDNPQKGRYRQFYQFDMDALGSEKSILDAHVIKSAMVIIQESGGTDISVDINSIGCKDCRPGYVRELVNYYKKHINSLPPVDRERLKTNPLRILDSKEEKTIEINLARSTSRKCSSTSRRWAFPTSSTKIWFADFPTTRALFLNLSIVTRQALLPLSDQEDATTISASSLVLKKTFLGSEARLVSTAS